MILLWAILGIAGKMGISLGATAVNAIRASGIPRKVYGVSRFSDAADLWQRLRAW